MNSTAASLRRSRSQQVVEFFSERLGQPQPSPACHARFGSSFRTRVSELNRDRTCKITILNKTLVTPEAELSVYIAVLRDAPTFPEFGNLKPLPKSRYPD